MVQRSGSDENKSRSIAARAVSVLGRQEWLDRPSYRLEHILTFVFFVLGGARHRVTNLLHGVWLGHPLHAPLAGLSTGAIGTTVALDALSALPGRSAAELRGASRSALGIGLLANIAAAVTGVTDWQHTHQQSRRVGLVHGVLNTGAIALYAMSWWDRRRNNHLRGIATSALGCGITLASSYLGGRLVFGLGVGVDRSGMRLSSPDWTPALPLAALPERQLQRVQVDGVGVILYRSGQEVSAVGEYCPHLGAPMADGWIDRGRVVCPWHGSRFAVESGAVRRGPAVAPLPCYHTRLVDGMIEVRNGAPSTLAAEGVAK